jgi:hypothetical protein
MSGRDIFRARRRSFLLSGTALAVLDAIGLGAKTQQAQAQQTPAPAVGGKKPTSWSSSATISGCSILASGIRG